MIPIIWFQFELEIPLNEIDTLQSANQEKVSFSDFVKDQLNNIKINLKKVWKFVNGPTLEESSKILNWNWKNKCTLCKDCKVIKKVHPLINYIMTELHPNLRHYFNCHICPSITPQCFIMFIVLGIPSKSYYSWYVPAKAGFSALL